MTNSADTLPPASPPKRRFGWPAWLPRPRWFQGAVARWVYVRTVFITIFLFWTMNAFDYSYAGWANSWLAFVWAGFPALTGEQLSKFGFFLLVGAALLCFYCYYLFHGNCKWRGIGGLKQIFLWRVVPLAGVGFFFWFVYRDWALEWLNLLFPASPWYMPWHLNHWASFNLSAFALLGVFTLIGWYYIFKKVWYGLGNSYLAAGLALCGVAALLWILSQMGLFSQGLKAAITLGQLIAGAAIGVCFSLTYIDRQTSATIGAAATVKGVVDVHEVGHHAPVDDGAHGHDVAAVDDSHTDGHR